MNLTTHYKSKSVTWANICFGIDIQQKTMRRFIFKIKALYFFSHLSCSTVFEHDKHVMITILSNQMEDICFERIHDDKKKAKI